MKTKYLIFRIVFVFFLLFEISLYGFGKGLAGKIRYIDYCFEHGSPLNWEIVGDSAIKISLLYDYERESPNRAAGHWFFKIEAEQGSHMKLILSNMKNVWNGIITENIGNIKQKISCYISYDRKNWIGLQTERLPEKELMVDFDMEAAEVYVARVPPYTTFNLEQLKKSIRKNKLVEVFNIGTTVEGRSLEMIRLGNPKSKNTYLLRGRAHPWESGGNWLLDGLIESYISGTDEAKKWAEEYCIYILPMANKDGVVRGMTRFNVRGKDLNRDWGKPADPKLCPENDEFEQFIESLIKKGNKPVLAIDIHNDDWGGLSNAPHERSDSVYIKKAQLFEDLMKKYTWFSEGTNYSWNTNWEEKKNFTMDDGIYYRYGIETYTYELNVNWIPRLNKIPAIEDWTELGESLNKVLYDYSIELNNFRK